VAITLDEAVKATPATRDRYVDFLRAASILVVVLGHWLIAIIAWDHGVIRSTSAIGKQSGLWLATWLFQVMPVFFFVGGYANLVAYDSARRRGDSTADFVRSRVRRLLVRSAFTSPTPARPPAPASAGSPCCGACARRARPSRSGRCGSWPCT
jgi:hypothetical protein